MTTYAAQIVFTESERVDRPRRWTGRLLARSECLDMTSDPPRPVTWTPYFNIEEDPSTKRCTVTMNGGSTRHSISYANHDDVTAAQEAGISWAARRFRVSGGL